jgi:phage terminase Nu1 subunit (DNA packaging protein)
MRQTGQHGPVTKEAFCFLLGIQIRSADRYLAQGMPRIGVGRAARYGPEAFAWYFAEKLEQSGRNKPSEDADNLVEAELRRTNADARLKELKADEMEGKLVDIAYVERTQAQINSNVRTRLLALPSKLTPQLVGVNSPPKVKAIIERETNQVCEELVKIAAKVPH